MNTNLKISENIRIASETKKLQRVIVHRPDDGIEKVTPASAIDLLYEDIVYLPKMQEEHDTFTKCLSILIGKENVIDIQCLLKDILEDIPVKVELIRTVCAIEKCDRRIEKLLIDSNAEVVTKALITGAYCNKKKISLFLPLPNLIFARDLGVIINDHLLITQASKKARSRESVLCYFIFHHHPIFQDLVKAEKLFTLAKNPKNLITLNGEQLGKESIEGGDVMVFNQNHLLIGCSERTTINGIEKFSKFLLKNKIVEKVTVIDIPKQRFYMHLDTIFTMLSENECVAFAPLIMQEKKMEIKQFYNGNETRTFSSLKAALLAENPDLEFIQCGEGIFPYDEREQWTDACNLFTIKPGVAFTYDRNVKTNLALEAKGYKIIKATDFIKEYSNSSAEHVEKTIITLPSSELSRARGGPHCMTFPILRS